LAGPLRGEYRGNIVPVPKRPGIRGPINRYQSIHPQHSSETAYHILLTSAANSVRTFLGDHTFQEKISAFFLLPPDKIPVRDPVFWYLDYHQDALNQQLHWFGYAHS